MAKAKRKVREKRGASVLLHGGVVMYGGAHRIDVYDVNGLAVYSAAFYGPTEPLMATVTPLHDDSSHPLCYGQRARALIVQDRAKHARRRK